MRILSAKEFIAILQGKYWDADTRQAKPGYKEFYQDFGNKVKVQIYKDVVVRERIDLLEGMVFSYPIAIWGDTFQNVFTISGGVFQDIFAIEGGYFHYGFFIDGGTFQGGFFIWSGNFVFFHITNGVFGCFFISKATFQDKFFIDNGIFHGIFSTSTATFQDGIYISGGYFTEKFSIGDAELKKISFQQSSPNNLFVNNIQFGSNTPFHAELLDLDINRLSLQNTTLHKDTIIHVNNIELNEIVFENCYNLGYILFNKVRGRNEVIKVIEQEKKNENNETIEKDGKAITEYVLVKEPRPSSFQIIRSDLGKTQFIGCDLSSFKKFDFESSKLTEVFLAGTRLPDEIDVPDEHKQESDEQKEQQDVSKQILNEQKERKKKQNQYQLEQKQLGYSQLKKIHEARGDMIRATHYYSKEMKCYYDSLRLQENRYEKFMLWFGRLSNRFPISWLYGVMKRCRKWLRSFEKRSETFMLWLGWKSNRFNTSWLHGVLFTFLVAALFFWLYCLSLKIYPVSPFVWENWTNFFDHLSHIFTFIQPWHRPGFMEGLSENGWSRLFDFAGRIFITYGIYQTIQAFRKHGKSS